MVSKPSRKRQATTNPAGAVSGGRGKPRPPSQASPSGTVAPELLQAFLLNPRSYPDHPADVQLMQTHASWVVLTRRFAFKIKKPVDFGFLDFSTLDKRLHFCEREVMLNRRLCPGVHLGVVPISVKGGRLVFGSGDQVVEYAVQMKRLSHRHFMNELILRGRVGTREVNAIVATLKRFYASQTPGPEIARWGRVTRLRISTDENFRQTQAFVGVTITQAAFEAIRSYTDGFYRAHRALFAERIREQRIRDCHGDLHLEHIHIRAGRPSIYDCIEFNDRFRWIDVASDAAFLAMDLDFHGRPDLARCFVTRLAAALADPGMLRLMDFYKCYRAYVRGKVESFHQIAAGLPEEERRVSRKRAEDYFRLALKYAVCGSQPVVLIVMGRVGSGKSTLAHALGRELGWDVFSSDRIRKELAGVPPYQRGNDAERLRLYSKAMTSKTYGSLISAAVDGVRAHRGVILDATFGRQSHRDRIRRVLGRTGVACCFIETEAATKTLKMRLKRRDAAAFEISDARLEDFQMLNRSYEPPAELDAAHYFVVSTEMSPAEAVARTLKIMARRQARVVVD